MKLTPRKGNAVFFAIALVSVAILLYGASSEDSYLMVTGIAVAAAALLFRTIVVRCPHCGRALGRDFGAYCQHCGKRIEK